MGDVLAFWLVPTHETRDWFTKQIAALGERFNAPTFEPHLTVHVGPAEGVASAASVVAEAAFEFEPITLRVDRVAHSELFTKTLFVEFHSDTALVNLQMKLQDRLPSDYVVSPHLSLLYHTLDEQQLEELANALQLPFQEVRFEVLQAVNCPAHTSSAEDVRSWHIAEEFRLQGRTFPHSP